MYLYKAVCTEQIIYVNSQVDVEVMNVKKPTSVTIINTNKSFYSMFSEYATVPKTELGSVACYDGLA